MKPRQRSLGDMVEQLAGMATTDRAAVLERLGPALQRRLAPYLDGGRPRSGVSPELASLFDDVGANRPVADMTPRAIDALRKATPVIDRQSGEKPPATLGHFGKLVSFMRGGGL